MILLAVLIGVFGVWASTWGIFACYHRPPPHDLLGMALSVIGLAALGLSAALALHPGFLG